MPVSQVYEPYAQQISEASVYAVTSRLCSLSSWMLKSQALELCEYGLATQSDLNAEKTGACWIVFANKVQATHGYQRIEDDETIELTCDDEMSGLLKPAFVLPFIWKPDTEHSSHLPESIRRVADSVRRTLGQSVDGQFGLHPGWRSRTSDVAKWKKALEDLSIEARSGWPMLAVGLWCLATGSHLESNIWATGVWDDSKEQKHLKPVANKTLAAKVWLAHQMGVEKFYVPSTQNHYAAISLPKGSSMQIGDLNVKSSRPLEALKDFRISIRADPPPTANEEDIREHYFAIFPSRRSSEFYRKELMHRIARRARAEFQPISPVSHIVIVLSRSWELIPLLRMITQTQEMLILHSGEDVAKHMADLEGWLKENDPNFKPKKREFTNDEKMGEHFARAVHDFRQSPAGAPDKQLTFDLTSASKLMNYEMIFGIEFEDDGESAQQIPSRLIARRSFDHFIYLKHRFHRVHKVPEPLTEELVMWPVGGTWSGRAAAPIADEGNPGEEL